MEIRNGLEGLRSLFGADAVSPSAARTRPQEAAASGGGDRATLSTAANQVAQSADGSGVRSDKVASIQAAIAAGTYHVPAEAVASKLVDVMLSAGDQAGQ